MTALDDSAWLQEQLAHSLTMLAGAWAAIPAERRTQVPPERLAWVSRWPAQRHLYHLYIYERITVDYAAFWLADGTPLTEAQGEEHDCLLTRQEEDWQKLSAAEMMAGWRYYRQELLARLARAENWEARQPYWDHQDLRTIAAECFQHTLEHTTTLLQLALFWDWG